MHGSAFSLCSICSICSWRVERPALRRNVGAGPRDKRSVAEPAGAVLPMTYSQRAAVSLPGRGAALPGLRGLPLLTLTAWHLARGACTVGAVSPRLDTAQRLVRILRSSCVVLRSLGVGMQVQGRLHAGAQMLAANYASWLDVSGHLSGRHYMRRPRRAALPPQPAAGNNVLRSRQRWLWACRRRRPTASTRQARRRAADDQPCRSKTRNRQAPRPTKKRRKLFLTS